MILNGDCIKEMQKLIDDGVQVDSVVTDPPYELGFMGRSWDSTGIAFQKETWELALKLLKPGGYLLAFSASRNYHRMAVAIEDVGFEIRDQMMWLYGSGFPKSMNVGKAFDKKLGNSEWEGWGTALKPAHEPIVMARKPLSEKSIVDNVLKHGTGAINIDECRVEGEVKRPDTNPDFRDVAKKAMAEGGQDKLNFNQITGAKRKKVVRKSRNESGVWTDGNSGMKAEGTQYADADPRGRFPANIMHDGSDVVQDIFPNTKTTYVSKHHANNRTTESAVGDLGHPGNQGFNDEGSASRYFYCPKTSKSERHNSAIKNTHPTVKPQKLMQYLCRMVTPKGGTVLDMFMGSGSTGMAAKDEGFDFIGIEKEKEYFEIAEARIESIEVKSTLQEFME
jgi:site-specific DNA-methyltransferase (adenine-specific)